MIEEEIKQGKLAKTTPVAAEEIYSSLQRQPIPRAKTHAEPPTWPSIEMAHSYQNYPVLPHSCNYSTYTEIKQEFNIQNFQTTDNNNEIQDPLKIRRFPNRYESSRTFYENPANMRNDVTRTPVRSPNYLALETRNYEGNTCGSPRNILNNSPRNYPEASSTNFEAAIDKTRAAQNQIYEDHREYTGYCENGQYKYGDNKEEYSSGLHNALTNVQSIDNMRSNYNECGQYNQNQMFPYNVGGKKMEQMRKMQRCRTPEILLAPHYLEGCNRQVCCQWGAPYT